MLKNVLSLLLSKFYSKKESGEVAKQSYPSTSATTIQLSPSDGITNKEMSYTPPSDGYIVLRDQGLPQSSSFLITGRYVEGVARGDKILFDFLMMTPVLKGVPVTIRYCGTGSVAQFIQNIGGGYQVLKKLILQGGGLCLNSLSSSLRRSSWLARKGKSLRLLLPRLTTVSRFPRDGREQINGQKPLQRHLTVGLELKEFAQAPFIWMSALIKTNCAKGRIETLALSRVFAECLRVRRLTTSLQQTGQSLKEKFCSFQATAPQLNAVNGGASC